MPRTCVILQPSYVPWRGVFDQIRQADVYVHYDDVQYDKNGWRNRNRVKGPNGSFWITIPVTLPSGNKATRLDDALISYRQAWQQKHWAAIRGSYRRAPHLDWLAAWLEPQLARTPERLVDFTIPLLEECAERLGLGATEFVRASSLAASGDRTGRLVEICREVGADRYLSGPAARDYLDADAFRRAGIDVEYASYDHLGPYPQLHGDYDPQVSIVDAFAMLGPATAGVIGPPSAP
jgi:hypothetical protein